MHPTFTPNKIAQVSHLCVCIFSRVSRAAAQEAGGQMQDGNMEYKRRGPRKRSVPGPCWLNMARSRRTWNREERMASTC